MLRENREKKMKQAFIVFTILICCSCEPKSEQTVSIQDTVSSDSLISTDSSKHIKPSEKKIAELAFAEWEKHEDSLRTEILLRKENKLLKQSFLQEMYIRNVVFVSSDSIFVTIPFNVHAADCGTPDCYTTNLSFSFKLTNPFLFPGKINFQEQEEGCVDKEFTIKGTFQLREQANTFVIYHCAKYNRALVLFNSNNATGTSAFYFTNVGPNRINGKNVFDLMKNYNEEDKNSIYPFTSWILNTNEYENFL